MSASFPLNPVAIIDKSSELNTENCKETPNACLWQCIVDAVVFASIFSTVSFTVDHTMPDINNVITFVCIWVPVLFFLKAMQLEYAEQLARVAGWSLGSKMFAALTA